MSRAILICWHKYTPFGDEFYRPMFDFFIQQMKKFRDEYDKIYFIDSTWNFTDEEYEQIKKIKGTLIKVSPSLRYYDAYKEVLPQVKEDLVLLMDNDMVIYRKNVIEDLFGTLEIFRSKEDSRLKSYTQEQWNLAAWAIFKSIADKSVVDTFGKETVIKWCFDFNAWLAEFDKAGGSIGDLRGIARMKIKEQEQIEIVSITDTIGTMKVPLKTGNKLCPYLFAAKKEVLLRYLDVDWSPDHMPYTETFGLLTESLLKDGVKVCEMEDDKSGIMFDGTEQYPEQHIKGGKGYYHIRSGSVPAYLLATKKYGNIDTYNDYLKNQPMNEILRQCAWYFYITVKKEGVTDNALMEILRDIDVKVRDWANYYHKFKEYHGLS